MSFVHPESHSSVKSELDLFSIPSTQTAIESSEVIEYLPIAALNQDGPIEFVVSNRSNSYIDLAQSKLQLTVRVVASDDTEITAAVCSPADNFLHSLFASMEMFLNSKLISSNYLMPYRAYIEEKLNYGSTAMQSHLGLHLMIGDEGGKFDSPDGKGWKERGAYSAGGANIELLGNLHADMFSQDKLLLSGVDLRLRFIKTKPEFHLNSTKSVFKTEIVSAKLLIRKVHLNPAVLNSHNTVLDRGVSAKYHYRRVNMQTVSIMAGLKSKSVTNLFLNLLPIRLILCFISNESLNGSYSKNCFKMHHYDVSSIAINVDNQSVPSKIYKPDIGQNIYMSCYNSLYEGTGMHYGNTGNTISRLEYVQGSFMIVCDLSPDLSASEDFFNLQRRGAVRIDLEFSKPLPETIELVVYSEFDTVLEIDKNREIIVDSSN